MPTKAILMPAFNRFYTSVIDRNLSGTYAYGFKYNINLINLESGLPVILDTKTVQQAHRGKIISLSFCKCEGLNMIASLADDQDLKIWDLENTSLLMKTEVKESCHVVEWIYGSAHSIVFPAEGRNIEKWNFMSNHRTKIKLFTESFVSSLKSNPFQPDLLAIGHMNGIITIVNVSTETLLTKLKAHSLQILYLSWNATCPNKLISTSRDMSFRMWDAVEGQLTSTYYTQRSKQSHGDDKKSILGISHPSHQDTIIVSNLRGEIGEVNLAESEKPKFVPYHHSSADHYSKQLASLFTSVIVIAEEKVDILISFDIYKIIMWNITSKTPLCYLPLIYGFVYDMKVCPSNPSILSTCASDGFIRIWNSNNSNKTKLANISTIFVQAKTRIMVCSFHPVKENILAFATDEGRVGICDIWKKKVACSFVTHHSSCVYVLNWAPFTKNPNQLEGEDYYLYSCGGGKIFINMETSPKMEAFDFDDFAIKPEGLAATPVIYTEISWRSDYSSLAIGCNQGYVLIYDKDFNLLIQFVLQLKTIENLVWHPEMTYVTSTTSPFYSWLACGGSDNEVHLLDTADTSGSEDGLVHCSTKKLTGHKKPVSSIFWSSYSDEIIASTSKDSTVIVWNAFAGVVIAIYSYHSEIVYTLHWSPFDPDVIYSGGMDHTLRIWNISEQSATVHANKPVLRKKLKKPKPSFVNHELNEFASKGKTVINRQDEQDNMEIQIVEGAHILHTEQNALNENDSAQETKAAKQQPIFDEYHKKCPPLFPMHGFVKKDYKLSDIADCLELSNFLSASAQGTSEGDDLLPEILTNISDEDVTKFGLFTDQNTALRMFENRASHYKSGDINCCNQLEIMSGNIKRLLTDAAANERLTSYLLSLAPMVSYNFWLEMCEKFAIQLREEKNPHKSSNYFLMCGRIYEAINVLLDKGSVIDALALARARLPDSDPIIPKIVGVALKKHRLVNNYLDQAKLYLSINKPLLAARSLAIGPSPQAVKAAAHVCQVNNLHKEAEGYHFLCLERCLLQCDWATSKQLVNEEPSMQVYKALVYVHESLWHHIRHLKKQEGLLLNNIFSENSSNQIKFWSGSTSLDPNQSFLAYVHNVLLLNGFSTDGTSLELMNVALADVSAKWSLLEKATDAHISVALYITQYILLNYLERYEAAERCILKIFEVSHNVVFLPKVLFRLFFPYDFYFDTKKKKIKCEETIHEELEFASHFKKVCNSFVRRIEKRIPQSVSIVAEDLLSDLPKFCSEISTSLSTKTIADSLLAYFISSFLNDFHRCIGKKNLFKNIEAKIAKNSIESNEVSSIKNSVVGSDDASEVGQTMEKLIEEALAEADKKIETLVQNSIQNLSLMTCERSNGENCNAHTINSEQIHCSKLENKITLNTLETNGDQNSSENESEDRNSHKENGDIYNHDQNGGVNDVNGDTGLLQKNHDSNTDGSNGVKLNCEDSSNAFLKNDDLNNHIAENISENLIENNKNIQENDESSSEICVHESPEIDCFKNTALFIDSSNTFLENDLNNHIAKDIISENLIENNKNNQENDESSSEICVNNESPEINCFKNTALFIDMVQFILLNLRRDEYALYHYLVKKSKTLENTLLCSMLNSKNTTSHSAGRPSGDCAKPEDTRDTESNLVDLPSDLDVDVVSEGAAVVLSEDILKNSANAESCDISEVKTQILPIISDLGEMVVEGALEPPAGQPVESNLIESKPSVDGECDTAATEDPATTDPLRKECEDIAGLISFLQTSSENISYPNPLVSVPQLVDLISYVVQNAEDHFAKELLHYTVDNVISWFNMYSISSEVMMCPICNMD